MDSPRSRAYPSCAATAYVISLMLAWIFLPPSPLQAADNSPATGETAASIEPPHPGTELGTQTVTAADVDRFFEQARNEPAVQPNSSGQLLDDPEAAKAFTAAQIAWYKYQANGYDFRMKSFERQMTFSLWIFVVVILLVISGIVFAGFQLFAGLFHRGHSQPGETELQLSATSFVVKTSIMGIVILAISCAFFFLYLEFVYPIQNTPW